MALGISGIRDSGIPWLYGCEGFLRVLRLKGLDFRAFQNLGPQGFEILKLRLFRVYARLLEDEEPNMKLGLIFP